MKKLIITVIIVLVVWGIWTISKKTVPEPGPVDTGNKTGQLGQFQFSYSPKLTLGLGAVNEVTLSHAIVYKHGNPCDFKGDAPALEDLADFKVTARIIYKSLADVLVDNRAEMSTDYEIGILKGKTQTFGVEGCGYHQYYFPISPSGVLVITRSLITEFGTITSDRDKYLALPGIIPPAEEEKLFNDFLSSFKEAIINQ